LKSLPAIDSISISANGNTISNLNRIYNSLSDYEKGFVDDDDAKLVSAYASKLNELIAQANYEAEQQAKKQAEEAAKETENETADEASAVNDSALTDAPSDSEISDEAINAIVTDNDDAGSSDGGDSEGSDDAEGV